jgi:hypothetical protein
MAVALHYGRNDPATQYFVPWLICDPDLTPPDWEIDLSMSRLSNFCRAVHESESGSFEGVLVKNVYRKQVWRLTGEVDAHGYLEGKWPD